MMNPSNTTHSHPICPTCQSDLTGKETLERFSGDGSKPLDSDNLTGFYEETARLILFLGTLAQAAPHAAADHAATLQDTPEWVDNLAWLARELAEEAERQLSCLLNAGRIWENRAESATADGKEG
jgi:hypothetical protein